MIEVHHLDNSRSQRILWLLEELGLEYQIVPYKRDPKTRLAPPELKAIHPLGKSPVIRDQGMVVAESGAIVEYLVGKYGNGRLAPPRDLSSPDYVAYLQWLHFAEGSAMLPLLLKLYVGRLKEAGAPLWPRIDSELKNHFDYMSAALGSATISSATSSRPPTSSCRSCSTPGPRAGRSPTIPISCGCTSG